MEKKYYKFHTLPSTNAMAKSLWNTFNPYKLNIVTARNQVSGKGKNNRKWISSYDSLASSFCFTLISEFCNTEKLFTLGSCSVQQLFKTYMSSNPIFKWPNDILVTNKKISGILCETLTFSYGLGIILGIGLNVNNDSEFCKNIPQPATSLFLETDKKYNLDNILIQLTNLIEKEILQTFGNDLIERRNL